MGSGGGSWKQCGGEDVKLLKWRSVICTSKQRLHFLDLSPTSYGMFNEPGIKNRNRECSFLVGEGEVSGRRSGQERIRLCQSWDFLPRTSYISLPEAGSKRWQFEGKPQDFVGWDVESTGFRLHERIL